MPLTEPVDQRCGPGQVSKASSGQVSFGGHEPHRLRLATLDLPGCPTQQGRTARDRVRPRKSGLDSGAGRSSDHHAGRGHDLGAAVTPTSRRLQQQVEAALAGLGAGEISRQEYLTRLAAALTGVPTCWSRRIRPGDWRLPRTG